MPSSPAQPTSRRLFGRLPNDPRKDRARLAPLPGGVVAPASADWTSGITAWAMLLNDQVGDCTIAGAAHSVMVFERWGRNLPVSFTDYDILAAYEKVSGYEPNHPETDAGATLQDALAYWRQTGIAGHKIDAFAQIDATNVDLVKACIAIFGTVYAGLNFPASAMDQFDAGQPWSIVKRSKIEGGHCVPLVGYSATSMRCVTWGAVQDMDLAFYERYFDECWVPISLDWLRSTGLSPAGLDVATLNSDYEAITGKPGPFPGPAPTPAPSPAPAPGPADDPRSRLVAAKAEFDEAWAGWVSL